MRNIEKYKEDLEKLISEGEDLFNAIQYESLPKQFEDLVKPKLKDKYDGYVSKLPSVRSNYQGWYSESLTLLKQLLPDRVNDFIRHYEKPKSRKEIKHGNYVLEDYLQNLSVTRGAYEEVVGPSSAISQLEQQLAIVKSVRKRFESSLFDIQQLAQADIFDSELDSAKELNKKGFARGAGAISGVVLEKHLLQVCKNHSIPITEKNPSISDFNDKLKSSEVIETPQWRKIQHLGDIRNLCDHNKENEPSKDDVDELIAGVDKLIKTLF